MIATPMDVLTHYQIRKTKKQKTAFLAAAYRYAKQAGYTVRVEEGKFGCRNLVIGDAAKAKYLVTAHYDTCPWMPVPNFITPCNLFVYVLYQIVLTVLLIAVAMIPAWGLSLWIGETAFAGFTLLFLYAELAFLLFGPANRHTANDNTSGVVTVLEILSTMPEHLKDRVAFVLFDLEESGLIGSATYCGRHKKQIQNQIVINLDCVGDGNEIMMFPTGKLRKDAEMMARFSRLEGRFGRKKICLHKKGFAFCPSDQMCFPKGIGVMAFHRSKLLGLYCDKIHTRRDRVLENTNVNLLRAAVISLIGF